MVEDAVSTSKKELEDMIECMSKHFLRSSGRAGGMRAAPTKLRGRLKICTLAAKKLSPHSTEPSNRRKSSI
jgi:hypothetical protein